jgi:hypothetical protein
MFAVHPTAHGLVHPWPDGLIALSREVLSYFHSSEFLQVYNSQSSNYWNRLQVKLSKFLLMEPTTIAIAMTRLIQGQQKR